MMRLFVAPEHVVSSYRQMQDHRSTDSSNDKSEVLGSLLQRY